MQGFTDSFNTAEHDKRLECYLNCSLRYISFWVQRVLGEKCDIETQKLVALTQLTSSGESFYAVFAFRLRAFQRGYNPDSLSSSPSSQITTSSFVPPHFSCSLPSVFSSHSRSSLTFLFHQILPNSYCSVYFSRPAARIRIKGLTYRLPV